MSSLDTNTSPGVREIDPSRAAWAYPPSLRFLPPQGIGTGDIESLTGILARLAQRHWMSPPMLARVAVAQFESDGELPAKSAFARRYAAALNGISQTGLRLAEALEGTTGSALFRRTCLHAWYGVVARNRSALQKRGLAWCPHCIRGDELPYHRLLWSIRDVEICPWHGTRLATTCPSCDKSQQPMSRLPSWYHCDSCEADLRVDSRIHEKRGSAPKPTEWEVWVARSAYKLIERTCAHGYSLPHGTLYSQVAPICRYLDPEGQDAEAAATLGIPKYMLRDWRNGRAYPSLSALWAVSYRLGVPPDGLLLDGPPLLESLTLTTSSFSESVDCIYMTTDDWKTVEQQLDEYLQYPIDDAPSISQAAAMMSLTATRLRYQYPDRTERIKRNHQERRRLERYRRKVRRVEEVLQVCIQLRSEGVYPSERKVRGYASVLPSDLRRGCIRAVLHAQQAQWRWAVENGLT